MSTFSREFFKAAMETPRMFFAPLIGAIDAISREFTSAEEKKKKKNKQGDIVVSAHSYRRIRSAARRAKIGKMKVTASGDRAANTKK